jgi:hypothetical protein
MRNYWITVKYFVMSNDIYIVNADTSDEANEMALEHFRKMYLPDRPGQHRYVKVTETKEIDCKIPRGIVYHETIEY